ncbi:hypothetical protein ACFRNT_11490 [Streptomyces sp. NPDC056697]|uniref:hypothetical protein n=1 Tax=Streptomyces sp. NPDC056697 TaxID=3345915 RepID=UPI0036CB0A23
MSTIDVDDLVSGWLISKWVEASANEHDRREYVRYSYEAHGPVSALVVASADADWECGCYSSWTREDDFVMRAVIKTAAGDVDFEYGTWGDFPRFIEELDEYRNNTTCPYESEEDE